MIVSVVEAPVRLVKNAIFSHQVSSHAFCRAESLTLVEQLLLDVLFNVAAVELIAQEGTPLGQIVLAKQRIDVDIV